MSARIQWTALAMLAVCACQTRLEVLRPKASDAGAPEIDAGDDMLGCSACSALELCAVNHCVDTTGTTALRSGSRHVCAVQGARLLCWGNNGSSQLGLGDAVDRLESTRVGNSEKWLDVAAGDEHTCGLRAPGELYCWGENSTGQLGLGDTTPRPRPARVVGPTDFLQLACGGDDCCALRQGGALYCWGDNRQGVTGHAGPRMDRDVLVPTAVAGHSRYARVSVGEAHVCTIDQAGKLWCWGSNHEGQLGVGVAIMQSAEPVQVGDGADYLQVSAGQHHTCAIRGEGELYCWGSNDFFELGVGTGSLDDVRVLPEPVRVDTASDWASVAVGWFHTCALKRSGALYCWGRGAEGQLGYASPMPVAVPTATAPSMRFAKLALGSFHTCAIDDGGAVYCWGGNTDGQLGVGDTNPREMPALVPF